MDIAAFKAEGVKVVEALNRFHDLTADMDVCTAEVL
jgi:hypothetical protein